MRVFGASKKRLFQTASLTGPRNENNRSLTYKYAKHSAPFFQGFGLDRGVPKTDVFDYQRTLVYQRASYLHRNSKTEIVKAGLGLFNFFSHTALI